MARRQSDDIIPNEADYQRKRAEMDEYMATHADPRHDYRVEVTVMGTVYPELVKAFNAKEAEAMSRQQWSLVGVVPSKVEVKEANA